MAYVYCISFILINMFIMMNLFILILLSEFANFRSDPENPVQLFKNRVMEFRAHWANFTAESKG